MHRDPDRSGTGLIGLFDSGLGGLSVLMAIRRQMADADVLYLADQARAPYGDRPLADVRTYAEEITDIALHRGVTTMVLGSNTISSAALHHLRGRHPGTTFVGLEPAVRPAVSETTAGVIAVLATTATIEGPLLADMKARFAEDVSVVGVALPGLVEMVEDGLGNSQDAEAFLAVRLAPALAAGADVFVLACTHYPFAAGALRRVIGSATIIDPAEAVARQVARVHPSGGSGHTAALTTGDPARLHKQLAEVAREIRFDGVGRM